MISDHQQRQQALDPKRSFIVQAPAGSGKTTLLTQRYITLLQHVKQPEEILAITFTRKAAAEMKNRIIAVLTELLNSATAPSFLPLTSPALERFKMQLKTWDLLHNPSRLRVMTLDALAHLLIQKMPLTTQWSAHLTVTDRPLTLYQQALANLTHQCPKQPSLAQAFSRLCLHLDNRFETIETLLIDMLAKRDHWLKHLISIKQVEDLNHWLTGNLERLSCEHIQTIEQLFPKDLKPILTHMIDYSEQHRPEPLKIHPNAHWRHHLNEVTFRYWSLATELLLTKTGDLRKQWTAALGFPAPSTASDTKCKQRYRDSKQQIAELSATLAQHPLCLNALKAFTHIPPPAYSSTQMDQLSDLWVVLTHLVAHLQVVFQETGQTDFVELVIRAMDALGEDQQPTDLALTLDYQIHHLLIDELQDTSTTHLQFIQKLISAWDENRTLFMVGDPMQSIYKFRDADVSLFAWIQQHGLAPVQPTALYLSSNFRSTDTLMHWINQTFTQAFPKELDLSLGAIPYAPSVATHTGTKSQAVFFHFAAHHHQEAQQILDIIHQTQNDNPHHRLAILAQSRAHLSTIIETLQQHQIAYQGIEIDLLLSKPIIQDLYALTRALNRPEDKTAWLSVLRAPWCGLSLNDLYHLSQYASEESLIHTLNQDLLMANISQDGKQRLKSIAPMITSYQHSYGRYPLITLLEEAWFALQGPLLLTGPAEQMAVKNYFTLLHTLAKQQPFINIEQLTERLRDLYAPSVKSQAPYVELMTIHKAKGLEFDTVILAGTTRGIRNHQSQLLYWQERTSQDGRTDLLLAPIKSTATSSDPVSDYLRYIESEKTHQEQIRLLYVAATRAKHTLHIMAEASATDPTQVLKKSSLLYPIRSHLPLPKEKKADPFTIEVFLPPPSSLPPIRRIKYPSSSSMTSTDNLQSQTKLPSLQGPLALNLSSIDSAYHQILQHIIDQQWLPHPELMAKPIFQTMLQAYIQSFQLTTHPHDEIKQLHQALEQTLADPKAQWFLNPHHLDSKTELTFSYFKDGQLIQATINRSFIEHHTRWIISYTLGQPTAEHIQAYYQKQLQHFAHLFQQTETIPSRLALYLPLTQEWMEWPYLSATSLEKLT